MSSFPESFHGLPNSLYNNDDSTKDINLNQTSPRFNGSYINFDDSIQFKFPSEEEVHENYGIPEIDSFIPSDTNDDQKFSLFNNGSSFTNETVNEVTFKNRSKRWLKEEDRQLVNSVIILDETDKITPQCLFDNISKNSITKQNWETIKDNINTEREISFLQSRYRKLVRNQKLNKHERLYLAENYSKYSIKELQLLFPGKTKETLHKLCTEHVQKNIVNQELNKVLEERIHMNTSGHEVHLDKSSHIVTKIEFDTEMFTDINSYINASSSDILSKYAPKVLRKLQYTIDQMSGEVYSKISALKACLKQSVVAQL